MAIAAVGKFGELSSGGRKSDPDLPALPNLTIIGSAQAAADAPKKQTPTVAEGNDAAEAGCTPSEVIFAEIQSERQLLEEQKTAILEREAKLQIGRQTIEIEAQKLTVLKTKLEELLGKVEKAQNDDVDRLVNLYKSMKPKEAAAIINELDMAATVLILGTMPERDAAPILANIDPSRARAISKILIERSKLPGDQDFSGIRLR